MTIDLFVVFHILTISPVSTDQKNTFYDIEFKLYIYVRWYFFYRFKRLPNPSFHPLLLDASVVGYRQVYVRAFFCILQVSNLRPNLQYKSLSNDLGIQVYYYCMGLLFKINQSVELDPSFLETALNLTKYYINNYNLYSTYLCQRLLLVSTP